MRLEENDTQNYTWLTAKELAARWKIHPVSLYRAVKKGKIPAMKIGKITRFPLELIEAVLIENKEKKED